MKKIHIAILFLCIFPLTVLAETSLGGMASNMMNPVSVLSDFVNSACLIVGGGFVFASLIKYMEHKRSPLMVPISTVVFLFVAGVILIFLPLVYKWTEGGVPFWAWK